MGIVGVGIDIVDTDRFRADAISQRAVERIFSDAERTYSLSMPYPERHFAARFAAKEAVVKAVAPLGIKLVVADIEIVKRPNGVVSAEFRPSAVSRCELLAANVITLHISVSHEAKFAIATAIAEMADSKQ
jgi:holo-[acyl-carrier protein] synthase